VLGDGFLQKYRKTGDARLKLEHGIVQEDYLKWKSNILCKFFDGSSKERIRERGTNKDPLRYVWYQSRVNIKLTNIYYNLYKKKEAEGYKLNLRLKWLNRFTALGLMVWYFDDGHLHVRDRSIIISVESLGDSNVIKLQKHLKIAWDIDSRLERYKYKNRDKFTCLLCISTKQTKKLIRIILPVIPRECKSLLYKVSMIYKQTKLQQRWISDIIELSQFSEKEIAEFYRTKLSDDLFTKCFPNYITV